MACLEASFCALLASSVLFHPLILVLDMSLSLSLSLSSCTVQRNRILVQPHVKHAS